jgi:CheY-like chemotaxis protein
MGRDPELPKHALTGIHVLVVEPDRDAATLLSTVLTHCGALVSVVHGVDEATGTLARVTPDIVVCGLPVSADGALALVHTIRTRRGPTRPGAIVVITQDDSGSAERALRAGFDAHLARPLDPWELCAVVAGVARRGS